MITISEYLIAGSQAGANFYLRRKLDQTLSTEIRGVVLFVHGATYGSTHTFDYAIAGYSWMDHLAQEGYDTWCLDLTGYGLADRPSAMAQPADANPPLMTTEDAIKEVSIAVDHILASTQTRHLSLIGYSWGTVICGAFAGQAPEKINRLILLGALWVMHQPETSLQPVPAYRTVSADSALTRWSIGLRPGVFENLIDSKVAQIWCQQAVEVDPDYHRDTHDYLRAPTGVAADFLHCAITGEPWYLPEQIQASTLIIVGALDYETTPGQAAVVFARLDPMLTKQMTVIADATHSILLEKRRTQLFKTCSDFLTA